MTILLLLYLVHKLVLWDLDQLHFPSVAISVVGELIAGQLAEKEKKQLVVLPFVCQIAGKGLSILQQG